MHWNVALDVFFGSKDLIRVLNHWLSDKLIINVGEMMALFAWSSVQDHNGSPKFRMDKACTVVNNSVAIVTSTEMHMQHYQIQN